MIRVLLGRLAGLAVFASLAFGAVAVADSPSVAQITVKCWKEYCIKDPDTGLDKCAKQQIACPAES
ncbi:MAG TPA: hypothetical protein VGC13_27225 [Longimicrobium sp.]|jgi:hypothetical protein|uniref:hypothetical protein n=1 Tax=Longimicrobium sp. TaxID=2029185 RepID=UPI002ED8AF9F